MSKTYKKRTIRICRGSGCNSMNAGEIHKILKDLLQEYKLSEVIKLKLTGCQGFCQFGPQIIIAPENVLYVKLKPSDIKEIIEKHLIENQIVERCLYKDPKTEKFVENKDEIQFYKEQMPIIRVHCGQINPEDINDFIAVGGYNSLKRVLTEFKPIEVIEEIIKSRLRGRGGAGVRRSTARAQDGRGRQSQHTPGSGHSGDPYSDPVQGRRRGEAHRGLPHQGGSDRRTVVSPRIA